MRLKDFESRMRAVLREFEDAAGEAAFCNSEWPLDKRINARAKLAESRQNVLREAKNGFVAAKIGQ